jgi:Flp pilus assembly protein TadG
MKTVYRFRTNDRGNTAVFFSLALIPLISLVGATLDYGRALSAQTAMQKAVDGTALTLVRRAATLSDAQLAREGQQIFTTMFALDPSVSSAPVAVTRTGKTIAVAASGAVKTSLMQVLGFSAVPVGARSEVAWGGKKIELSLVLDNTGSMNEVVNGKRKLDFLKDASLDLLRKLNGAATNSDDIKVAVVPFDTHVRVDADANRYAPWLRLDASDRLKWHGYIEDRGGNARGSDYDTNDEAADALRPESLYPAVLDKRGGQDLAGIQPLTSIIGGYETLKSTVGAMRGIGCTNITIGAAWGMATLSQGVPFTEAAKPSSDLEKIMVVVTDGDNTQNRWDGDCRENTPASARIDARTEMACAAAKTNGVKVITIRLVEGNKKLLRDCATTVSDLTSPFYNNGKPLFYNVENPKDLEPAFRSIMDMILGTRVTA